jgi:hypothetical protein
MTELMHFLLFGVWNVLCSFIGAYAAVRWGGKQMGHQAGKEIERVYDRIKEKQEEELKHIKRKTF